MLKINCVLFKIKGKLLLSLLFIILLITPLVSAVQGLPYVSLNPIPFQTGSISVASYPEGAGIYLDGQYKSTTPYTITGVSVGSHTIKVTKTGYCDWSHTVAVTGSQTSSTYAFASLNLSPVHEYKKIQLDEGVEATIDKWIKCDGNVAGIAHVQWEGSRTPMVFLNAGKYIDTITNVAKNQMNIPIFHSRDSMIVELQVHTVIWPPENFVEGIVGQELHDSNPADIELTYLPSYIGPFDF